MSTILDIISQRDWQDKKVQELKEHLDEASRMLGMLNPEANVKDAHECLKSLIGEHVIAKPVEKKASGKPNFSEKALAIMKKEAFSEPRTGRLTRIKGMIREATGEVFNEGTIGDKIYWMKTKGTLPTKPKDEQEEEEIPDDDGIPSAVKEKEPKVKPAKEAKKRGRQRTYSAKVMGFIKREVAAGRSSTSRLQKLIKEKFDEEVNYQAIWKYVDDLRSSAPEKKEEAPVAKQGKRQILSDIDGELKGTKPVKHTGVSSDEDFEGLPNTPDSGDEEEEDD